MRNQNTALQNKLSDITQLAARLCADVEEMDGMKEHLGAFYTRGTQVAATASELHQLLQSPDQVLPCWSPTVLPPKSVKLSCGQTLIKGDLRVFHISHILEYVQVCNKDALHASRMVCLL